MSKGIKMLSAKDAQGGSHSVDSLQTQHDNNQTIPTLFCDSLNCGRAVRFVKRHTKNRTNHVEPIHVPAYIGLSRGSEHVLGCRYDAPGRLKLILAAASDPNFMHALDDGKRELRLLILHQGLKGKGASGNAVTPPPSVTGNSQQSPTQFQATSQQLDSYLRTTADLLALRAACDDDELLAAQLTLRFGEHTLAWTDFFFEPGRYDEVWEKLAPDAPHDMPLALLGTVKSHISPPPGAKYTTTYLNCEAQYNHTGDPNRREYFQVSVGHGEGAWLQTFPVGSQLVMFGLWKRGEPTKSTKPYAHDAERLITYVTHKLSLSPPFKLQLASVI